MNVRATGSGFEGSHHHHHHQPRRTVSMIYGPDCRQWFCVLLPSLQQHIIARRAIASPPSHRFPLLSSQSDVRQCAVTCTKGSRSCIMRVHRCACCRELPSSAILSFRYERANELNFRFLKEQSLVVGDKIINSSKLSWEREDSERENA